MKRKILMSKMVSKLTVTDLSPWVEIVISWLLSLGMKYTQALHICVSLEIGSV